jgi:hypothetical protein
MGAIMAEKAISCMKKYLQTTDAPQAGSLINKPLTNTTIMVYMEAKMDSVNPYVLISCFTDIDLDAVRQSNINKRQLPERK